MADVAGAGSIWHSDGLIVTNADVVGGRALEVTLPDGRELPARLLAHDRSLDLAALSVDADGLPAIDVGDSRSLQPGQLALAMGHPWGVHAAATAVILIAIGVGAPPPGTPVSAREWIVAGLQLRPGHSGGHDDRHTGADRRHQHHDHRARGRHGRPGTSGQRVPPGRAPRPTARRLRALDHTTHSSKIGRVGGRTLRSVPLLRLVAFLSLV